MKKLISLLILFAILISCCACTAEPNQETTNNTEASAEATGSAVQSGGYAELTPEQMYGHINQLEPVEGIYKIWSEVGVQNMADHPEATFELLCNVDMQGAALTPIGTADKPFTGEIKGANFTISNFTLQGGDETDFGFVGVNKGTIRNFLIDNVTFVPGPNAKNIGSLVGDNQGEVNRCTVSGTMNVEAAAAGASCGGAVGVNTGSLANTVVTVDLNVTAAGAANVGGIVGTTVGGTLEFVDTNGKLDVTGTNKTVGLLAGSVKDIEVKNCAFVGATNTVDGVLFTNFAGSEENSSFTGCLWRDNEKEPLSESVQKVRDTVVQKMYEMGTIEWTTSQNMRHSCSCQLSNCHGVYVAGKPHYGIPYNHKGGSLARMEYCLDENGVVKDFIYDMADFDGFDAYIGNDCSTALIQAWWTVSNTVDFLRCNYMIPLYDRGCIAVGDYAYDITMSGTYTEQFIELNGEQVMYESYAKMRKGDAYVYMIEAGGHARMAAEDAVVVRDQEGKINGEYSYVISHEQGSHTITEESYTSWKIYGKYTFANILATWALPVTCEELLTGEMEPVECALLDGADGMSGLFNGTVKSNYYLDSVSVEITDSKGATVMDHRMFPTSGRWEDTGHNDSMIRVYNDEYDMAHFATALQDVAFALDETYSYTVTAHLATGDDIVVKEDSFVYGAA